MGPTRVTIDTNHNDTTEVHTWYEYWCWYLQVWGGHTFWSIHIHTLIAKGYYYSYRRVRQQHNASDHSEGGHTLNTFFTNTLLYCACNWCWRLSTRQIVVAIARTIIFWGSPQIGCGNAWLGCCPLMVSARMNDFECCLLYLELPGQTGFGSS